MHTDRASVASATVPTPLRDPSRVRSRTFLRPSQCVRHGTIAIPARVASLFPFHMFPSLTFYHGLFRTAPAAPFPCITFLYLKHREEPYALHRFQHTFYSNTLDFSSSHHPPIAPVAPRIEPIDYYVADPPSAPSCSRSPPRRLPVPLSARLESNILPNTGSGSKEGECIGLYELKNIS
jgi:hypothetical protein